MVSPRGHWEWARQWPATVLSSFALGSPCPPPPPSHRRFEWAVPSPPSRWARSRGKPWDAGILLQQVQRALRGCHTPLLVTASVGHYPRESSPCLSLDVSPQGELHRCVLTAPWGVPHHPGYVTLGWAPSAGTCHLGVGSTSQDRTSWSGLHHLGYVTSDGLRAQDTASMGTSHPDHPRQMPPPG